MGTKHSLRHVYREANSCADWLANLGRLQDVDFVLHSSPPVDLVSFVMADCQGVFSKRLGPVSLFPS